MAELIHKPQVCPGCAGFKAKPCACTDHKSPSRPYLFGERVVGESVDEKRSASINGLEVCLFEGAVVARCGHHLNLFPEERVLHADLQHSRAQGRIVAGIPLRINTFQRGERPQFEMQNRIPPASSARPPHNSEPSRRGSPITTNSNVVTKGSEVLCNPIICKHALVEPQISRARPRNHSICWRH